MVFSSTFVHEISRFPLFCTRDSDTDFPMLPSMILSAFHPSHVSAIWESALRGQDAVLRCNMFCPTFDPREPLLLSSSLFHYILQRSDPCLFRIVEIPDSAARWHFSFRFTLSTKKCPAISFKKTKDNPSTSSPPNSVWVLAYEASKWPSGVPFSDKRFGTVGVHNSLEEGQRKGIQWLNE